MAMTSAQYVEVVQGLLPKGKLWLRNGFGVLFTLLLGISDELARVDQAIDSILEEADPRTAKDLISDWENFVSLPDSTQAISTLLDERRADVHRKLTDPGGQSDDVFASLAQSFGYSVKVRNFTPFCAGTGTAGKEVFSPSWRGHWGVFATGIVVRHFSAGDSAGQPLTSWRNSILEAVIKKAAQSQSTPHFYYGS